MPRPVKSPAISVPRHSRRKIRYVDDTLQKFLLVGLVVLETALAAGLTWVMFRHLTGIIDDNMYRVHLADAAPLPSQLRHSTLILLGLFCIGNVAALVLVDFIWRRHAYSILRLFMHLVAKTRALDFTADPETGDRHQLLSLAQAQRKRDRNRLRLIRKQMSGLEAAVAADDMQAMHDMFNTLDELLPKPTATSDLR